MAEHRHQRPRPYEADGLRASFGQLVFVPSVEPSRREPSEHHVTKAIGIPDEFTTERPATDPTGSIRLCAPRDLFAIVALAARGAWRRQGDAPLILGLVRLAIWPISAALLVFEGGSLWTNPERTAILAAHPTMSRRVRLGLILLGCVIVPMLVVVGLAIAVGAEDEVLVASLLVMVLMLECLRHCGGVRALRVAKRNLRGPGVVEATNLLAATPGAGVDLARHLCALADATGTTIVAEARGPARQRLYRRFGFETIAKASGAALIRRVPRQSGPIRS